MSTNNIHADPKFLRFKTNTEIHIKSISQKKEYVLPHESEVFVDAINYNKAGRDGQVVAYTADDMSISFYVESRRLNHLSVEAIHRQEIIKIVVA